MEQLDTIIKLALKENLNGLSLDKSASCPDEADLAGYFAGSLPRKKRNEIACHIADCPACLEDLVLAGKASGMETKKRRGGSGGPQKWLKKNLWILLAVVTFVLSFVYSSYFVQFLIATLVLSGKWIFETINARILIMVYDAWKKGGEKEVGKVLERYNSHIRIK